MDELALPAPASKLSSRPSYAGWWLALLAVSTLLFFYNLHGGARLTQPECWVAQTAREMRAGGDWLVPHFAGEIRLQKTPGPYWLAAAVAWLRGSDIDAASVRIPNAAAALLIVVTMTAWCRRNLGDRTAIFAGFTLTCSLFLLYWSHQGSSDLGLAALCTLAVAALWEADRPQRESAAAGAAGVRGGRTWWVVFYVSCGLGMLYKGPVPVGVVGFPLIAYVIAWRRWRLPLQMSLPLGLVIFAAPWLPWVAYIGAHLGADAFYRWRAEFVDRATGELPGEAGQAFNIVQYLGYYLPVIAAFAIPWTLSLPDSWRLPFRRNVTQPRGPLRFLLLWGAAVWLCWTLSVAKQNRYILAVLPPFAALLGAYFSELFRSERRGPRLHARILCTAISFGIAAGVVAGGWGLAKWAGRNDPSMLKPLLLRYLPAAAIMLAGFPAAVILYLRGRGEHAFAAICATMAGAWCLAWTWLMPIVAGEQPAVEMAAALNRAELKPVEVYYLGVQDARVIYYGGRAIPRIVNSIEMFRRAGGRRNLQREYEEIGRATVERLRDGSRTIAFVAGEPELKKLRTGLERAGQLDGLPMYEWFRTSGRNDKRRLVLFANTPAPPGWNAVVARRE